MRKTMLFLLVALLASTVAMPVLSAESTKPIGVALFNPAQWPDENASIKGLRVNAIYAKHENLTGVDFGILFPFNRLTGTMKGVQLGLYNQVDGNAKGIQWGLVNQTKGSFKGLQLSWVNLNRGAFRGAQLGLYNDAPSVSGTQIGILNRTKDLHGLQVGLVNMKGQPGGQLPNSVPARTFPIVNWTF